MTTILEMVEKRDEPLVMRRGRSPNLLVGQETRHERWEFRGTGRRLHEGAETEMDKIGHGV